MLFPVIWQSGSCCPGACQLLSPAPHFPPPVCPIAKQTNRTYQDKPPTRSCSDGGISHPMAASLYF
ncbi:hypothetical protein CTAM01_12762 [Colletotrichum tamarilloi]|uniref:Uncharacterized protein n=1 Tax=Colletotrichum tamarilloi TaxID=1209934 RepID=A0ABQ9T7Y1_9PEZI|nr:uncharacterized protein CTAM01_12762 [Colletotrichum tamarilloi]KAK1731997.1 hypothetical protein CTAM01_12762 [Colletotrichum tamarilloi]